MSERSWQRRVADVQSLFEQELSNLRMPAVPKTLYGPARYVLEAGGKRIRPVLLLLAASACGGSTSRIELDAAMAVEVFHNFTLVHDDIMDRAPTRRGRATVHEKWDDGVAILCGDLLHSIANSLIAGIGKADVSATFGEMVVSLCEGQALDVELESRDEASVADYFEMIDLKTGALLAATMKIGGLIGGASPRQAEALSTAGRLVGRAFQVMDDLLDLVADDDKWGKGVGGDLREGKKTYILTRALEKSTGDDRRWFESILVSRGLPDNDIAEARTRMEDLGVLTEARDVVHSYTDEAVAALGDLPAGNDRDALVWLIGSLSSRLH